MDSDVIYFVQISDTHIGAERDYSHRGTRPFPGARAVLDQIRSLPVEPAFVIHTGDVCGDKEVHASSESYELARELFSTLEVPLYVLPGNHDETPLLKGYFPLPDVQPLSSDPDRLAYYFCKGNIDFFCLDASIRSQRAGVLPQDQLKAMSERISHTDRPFAIFLHYPPIPLDSPWMDENMLLQNGLDLHMTIKDRASRCRGVFFGHCHNHMQIVRDGILYYSCASTFIQFRALPGDTANNLDHTMYPGFNLIRMDSSSTNIRPRNYTL